MAFDKIRASDFRAPFLISSPMVWTFTFFVFTTSGIGWNIIRLTILRSVGLYSKHKFKYVNGILSVAQNGILELLYKGNTTVSYNKGRRKGMINILFF